jgi:hypothetical protein
VRRKIARCLVPARVRMTTASSFPPMWTITRDYYSQSQENT